MNAVDRAELAWRDAFEALKVAIASGHPYEEAKEEAHWWGLYRKALIAQMDELAAVAVHEKRLELEERRADRDAAAADDVRARMKDEGR